MYSIGVGRDWKELLMESLQINREVPTIKDFRNKSKAGSALNWFIMYCKFQYIKYLKFDF